MAEVEKVRHLLDRAEQAAMGADFVSAEELLKRAATIQEQALGPRHPDLANTLNNLAIVAEKTGHPRCRKPLSTGSSHRGCGASARPSDGRGDETESRGFLSRTWGAG